MDECNAKPNWLQAATLHHRATARSLHWLLAVLCWAFMNTAAAATFDWQNVERIVAIGDIHGSYQGYYQILEHNGLVDQRGRWAGGETHLVQIGDIVDRGPDSARVIEHLLKLRAQARRAGGEVHLLVGNHEAMNITGDLRYVHPGEYAAMASRGAERLREAYYQQTLTFMRNAGRGDEIDQDFRERWLAAFPAGYVEHRKAWHPNGRMGKLYSTLPAAIRINRTLFVHAGIGPRHVELSLEQLNKRINEELAAGEYRATPEQLASKTRLAEDEQGPLWYRDLGMDAAVVRVDRGEGETGGETALNEAGSESAASADNALLPETAEQRAATAAAAAEQARAQADALQAHLRALLAQHKVDRIVVGHTPGFGTVVPRHGGRVLVIDSGIGPHYGGHLASLVIEGEQLYTNHRGTRVPLPARDRPALDYFRSIAELEPEAPNLQYLINRLEAEAEASAP